MADNAFFKDKIYVVTGAASGMGKETARLLKKAGAYVIGIDRNPLEGLDRDYQTDLSDPAAIDQLVERLPDSISGLCNIAGLPPTVDETQVLTVNLLAVKRLTLGLIPKLARGASIVHLASVAGARYLDNVEQVNAANRLDDFEAVQDFVDRHGIIGARSYDLSKEALIAWTHVNALTWKDQGIRMNCVSPGPVDTPILEDFLATLGERAHRAMQLLERAGHPADIAPVVLFLLSDEARWVNGSNLFVDGGLQGHRLTVGHGLE